MRQFLLVNYTLRLKPVEDGLTDLRQNFLCVVMSQLLDKVQQSIQKHLTDFAKRSSKL